MSIKCYIFSSKRGGESYLLHGFDVLKTFVSWYQIFDNTVHAVSSLMRTNLLHNEGGVRLSGLINIFTATLSWSQRLLTTLLQCHCSIRSLIRLCLVSVCHPCMCHLANLFKMVTTNHSLLLSLNILLCYNKI